VKHSNTLVKHKPLLTAVTPAAALTSLEAARKLCPRHAEILIAVGNLQFQVGNFPACFDALQSAGKLRRNDPLVHVLLATAAVRLQKYRI